MGLLNRKTSLSNIDRTTNEDKLKRATKVLKGYGFRVIKKPRYNNFALIDLKVGKVREGRGYSLELNDLIDLMLYYNLKYRGWRKKEQLQFHIKKLNNNPRLHGEYAEGSCDDGDSSGYIAVQKGEVYKTDKRLLQRAKAFKLSIIRYPYHIIWHDNLYDSYIIFNKKTGTLIGKEGWTTWNRVSVEDYLDKLERGEIML